MYTNGEPWIKSAPPYWNKWDQRFLKLAKEISTWSKDPSRKIGAVIVAPDRSIISMGYNGFARGVEDTEERYTNRDIKLELVVHAEINAIVSARRSVEGATLYCTLLPCSRCAAVIINAGIKRVVAPEVDSTQGKNATFNFNLTETQFEEAKVLVTTYNSSVLFA